VIPGAQETVWRIPFASLVPDDDRHDVRAAIERVVASGAVAYGIKTGFGELAHVVIPDADARQLQLNLLRSHAVGQGEPLPADAVRASLLLRANTLARGVSGVRLA